MFKNLNTDNLLSQAEICNMIVALGRGQNTFTENDVRCVYEWALNIRVEAEILNLIIADAGETFTLQVENGEILVGLTEWKK